MNVFERFIIISERFEDKLWLEDGLKRSKTFMKTAIQTIRNSEPSAILDFIKIKSFLIPL
jgi:hypothetical protein